MKLKHFLLTALLLFAGVSGVYAGRKYVGFTSAPSGTNYSKAQLKYALDNAGSGDTVFVAAGLYLADTATAVGELIVPERVTLIGGYAKGDATTLTRRYPGQFVPFKSSVVDTNEFTILDGNSYLRTLPSKKHRVITVLQGGVVDGCLIRNGHARNSNGGGVLLDGGKLYNSIIRGNVAMNHPDSAEALGGGVFIQQGGELINCLVAYNMANDGYGVAAGTGGGRMINNTITANTYAPVFAKITAGTYLKYKGDDAMSNRPSGGVIPKWDGANQRITMNEFYISRILTTQGQYAVFCAAMDITKTGTSPIYGQLNVTTLKNLPDPIRSPTTVGSYYNCSESNLQNMFQACTDKDQPGLNYTDGVWHPIVDTVTVEYPMGFISWYGGLAYAVWLGGGVPSMAQWEFAARREPDGTVNENLYSGAYGTISNNDTVTWRILDTIAWVERTKAIDTTAGSHFGKLGTTWTNRPHEVARKRPNAMGIYDMTGNMMEWCADFSYTATPPGSYPYSSNPVDPVYTNNARPYRQALGGSYMDNGRGVFSLTLASWCIAPTLTDNDRYGFRPVVKF